VRAESVEMKISCGSVESLFFRQEHHDRNG
jgi:hypothetical protein